MPRLSYSTFKSRLVFSSSLLTALLAVLIFWKICSGIKADKDAAFSQTRSFAQAMGAHVASQTRVVDMSLLRAAEALGSLGDNAVNEAERARQILALSASASDQGFWIHFLDANGVGVAASNGLGIAGVSYAERPYFKVHTRNRSAGLHVDPPQAARVSGRRLFFMSRGVFSAGGDFLGVVVASVDAAVFARVFSDALLRPTLSITLLHRSGVVIARAPFFERSFASDMSGSDLYRHLSAAPSGSYEGRSMLDGAMRVFSYQTVGDAGLVVAVGMAVDSWTRAIPNDVAVALSGFAVILVALLFSGRYALRSFKRLERSDADLRWVNDELRRVNVELRGARDENARGEKRARMIADSLPALVSYVDANERYVFHNSYYGTLLGSDAGRMLGRTIEDALGEVMYGAIADQVRAALNGRRVTFERSVNVGSQERVYKFEYTPDFSQSGVVVGFYTMAVDITEAKAIQRRLDTLARFDALTGLPNRAHLYERLEAALGRLKHGGAEIACLFLDIDHFKSINDSLGHAAGDEALREFAKRLRSAARQIDLVARLAGDEFVILLEGLEHPSSAAVVAEKVIEAMRTPFVILESEMVISTSVGVAVCAGQDDSADALLKRADEALYLAKRAGRGVFKTSERPAPSRGEL